MIARPKVLCIEDDPETVDLLVEVLLEEGYAPIIARDGIEGVAKFAESPNIVLCDVDMPQMSGFGVLQKLRQSSEGLRNVPFLFVTAYGSRENHLQARRLGCDDFLTKPLDFELLIQILVNRLAQGPTKEAPSVVLTDREVEVLTWVARGKSSVDIAKLMNVSDRTVNFHVNNVIQKFGVATRVQAAIRCALLGLINV